MNLIDHSEDHARVNHWLHGLSGKTGLSLRLDADGICAIGHSSGLDCAVEVPDGERRLYLRIPLMPWPSGDPAALAELCLSENFLGSGTHGACFAIDRQECELVIWMSRSLDLLDEAAVGLLLVQFFETASACKDRLEAFCRGEAAVRPDTQPAFARFA